MKVTLAALTATFLLVGCNPQKQYNKMIQDIGYIAYRTPLSSSGTGTIIKGKPGDLIVYTKPERCLPDILADGTHTKLRYQEDTDLPAQVREVKVDFSADLSFFGSNGNPLFTVNSAANYVKKVEAKFSDAKIERIDEIVFWNLFENRMSEECKTALMKYPAFWQTLKVGKMDFVFKNEAGASIKLAAPMIKDIVKIDANVSWSIKNEYTLSIETPKYIGFVAAQLTEEGVRTRSVNRFSNKVNSKGDFVWFTTKSLNRGPLKGKNLRPMY